MRGTQVKYINKLVRMYQEIYPTLGDARYRNIRKQFKRNITRNIPLEDWDTAHIVTRSGWHNKTRS